MSSFSFRNVCCDFYLDKPNAFNRQIAKTVKRLPVIRIFGILNSGQKCCIHIHGVFPYIILKCDASASPQFIDELRSVINTLVGRKDNRLAGGESAVYNIELIPLKSIYGYYEDVENFVKISFCSPYHVHIVTVALQQGALPVSSFHLFEAHVPYLLQFFIDYSLFGMDLVHLTKAKCRISPRANTSDLYMDDLTVGRIISDNALLSPLLPLTSVAVECDVFASDIKNSDLLSKNEICNPGLNYIWKDEERRCLRRGVQLKAESSQEERPCVVNDRERDWLKQLKQVCGRLRSRGQDENSFCSNSLYRTFLNETVTELDYSNLMGEEDFDSTLVGQLVYEDDRDWTTVEKYNADESFEGNKEVEDAKEMSQPLSSLYETANSLPAQGEHCADDAKLNVGPAAVSDRPHSACSDDIFGDNLHEQGNHNSEVSINVKEVPHFSPDMFDEETMQSWKSGSSDLFGSDESAIFFFFLNGLCNFLKIYAIRVETDGDMEECESVSYRKKYVSSSLPIRTDATSAAKNKNCSQSSKLGKRYLDSEHKVTFIQTSRYSDNSSDQDDLEPSSVNLYETDVGNFLAPSKPVFDICSDAAVSTQSRLFQSVVRENRNCKKSDDEAWLAPVYSLPLRRPSEYPITEESGGQATSTSDLSSPKTTSATTLKADYKTFFDSSLLESWCEPSFFNYSMNRERLEATLVIPEEPLSNTDKAEIDIRHLCVFSMEILASVREGQRVPDPLTDPILGVFCCVITDVCLNDGTINEEICFLNINSKLLLNDPRYHSYESEDEVFDALVEFVQRYDPDIVLGYNVKRSSWGYLVERSIVLGRNLLSELSRYKIDLYEYWRPDVLAFNFDPVPRGRVLINVLHSFERSPNRLEQKVSSIFTSSIDSMDHITKRTSSHLLLSSVLNLRILCQLDFFTRTAEMARVYGIQFSEVLSRGSQFRVESMLLRLARLNQLAAATVSPAQRQVMPSPETLPLTMEPETGLYRDPVIVLDFQSLYPSVMIAYNYCFSTCLGRVTNMKAFSDLGSLGSMRMGATSYDLPVKALMNMLEKDDLHISPVGGVFCKKSVRKGVVPIMLEEILDTRIMVKKALKTYNDNARLRKILDARQLALKLIANVTYGYSAANFSGRMPCVEVADAIVSKGREALEVAIAMVNAGTYRGARVIYGDTDSLFVLCPGLSRKEAFEVGECIARDVTMKNPKPMKLKLEKIMQPLILETKKRYVGMSYEKPGDEDGVFDAKGIETVRRDNCPLVARILEKALRIVFTGNLSALVRYLDLQLSNLDQLPLTDFIFSKEYRKHYADTAVVPAKKIAERRRINNKRDEPESGERVPYVIVAGPPDSTLISCVREPWEFVNDRRLLLNFDYYVHRQILPPLHRAFETIPIKFEWHRPVKGDCYSCNAIGVKSWCSGCVSNPETFYATLCDFYQERKLESQMNRACANCIGLREIEADLFRCKNLACSVTQKRIKLRKSKVPDAVRLHHLSCKEINFLF